MKGGMKKGTHSAEATLTELMRFLAMMKRTRSKMKAREVTVVARLPTIFCIHLLWSVSMFF